LRKGRAITDRFSSEKVQYDYPIAFTATRCNFGGVRYWFICPLVIDGKPCRRRVAKLYLPPGGKYFGCRHCYNLTYRSCKEHDKRVDAIVKNPKLLRAYLGGNNLKGLMLAWKAEQKLMQKLNRLFPR
jgi:hypothetical protein